MSIRFSLHTAAEKTMTIADTPTAAHMSNTISGQRSPWHSPVPYLFGGLAAMLGLIAFALLVLACSYWRLSGYLENERDGGDVDEESGSDHGADKKTGPQATPEVYEEKYLVIMAGQQIPTCLATPMWSRASSFGSTSKSSSCSTSTTISNTNTEGGCAGASSFGDEENKDKIQHEESNHHVIDMSAPNPPHHHHQQEQEQQHVSSSSQS